MGPGKVRKPMTLNDKNVGCPRFFVKGSKKAHG